MGYNWSDVDVDGNYDYYSDGCDGKICSDSLAANSNLDSAIALLDVGADYQLLDNIVLGVGADFSIGSASQSYNVDDRVLVDLEVGNTWTIYSRLGYAIDERFLAYGLIGWTNAEVDQKVEVDDWNGSKSASNWLEGLTLGAGLETMLSEKTALKLEYRYTDLGSLELSDEQILTGGNCGSCVGTFSASTDMSMQSVRAIVSYRF